MNEKIDDKYRLKWISDKSGKSYSSPFVFSYSDIKRRIKNLKKMCPDVSFDIEQSHNHLAIEIYPEKKLIGQALIARLRKIERVVKDEKKT